jgi:HK97 family phage prohead protease
MTNIAVRGTVLRSPADGSRVITFRASTPRVDRHGTRIIPSGIDTREYDKNPVFAWGHDATGGMISPPSMDHVIGRVVAHRKDASAFDIDVEFVPGEVSEKAERAFQLVKKGFLNAVSIGFIPTKWHDESSDNDRGSLRVYDEVQLLEVSLVPVPSNADCVALSRHFFGASAETRRYDLEELEALEAIYRAGAVLNRANKDKLTRAAGLISEVLATAAKEEATEEPADEGRGTPVTIAAPAGTTITRTEDGTIDIRAPEDEDNQDDDGVYIARRVVAEDAKKIAKWAKERGIADLLDEKDFHVTVVASRASFDADAMDDDDEEMRVKIKGIKRFKDTIALTLDAPKLTSRHKAARDKGASHDFATYQPHISLSYNGAASDLPKDFPSMTVKLGPEYRKTFKDIETKNAPAITQRDSAPPAPDAADIGAAVRTAISEFLTRTAIQEGIRTALRAA